MICKLPIPPAVIMTNELYQLFVNLLINSWQFYKQLWLLCLDRDLEQ